eukprot:gene4613-6490_t
MSDEVERTLCQLPQVHVFKIPARKSADGYRASDWPKDPTWSGKLKIVSKGRTAAIILMDDKNQTFAICPVTDDAAVERTLDSGRYFVLRIKNAQDRHAFIGIAFNERNDAFDFNVALAEFKSECEREDQASKLSEVPIGPMKDLSLKDGEKIKIKVNLKGKKDKDNEASSSVGGNTTKTSTLLPPPKSSTSTILKPSTATDDWGSSFGSDPFSSSDPFSTSTTSAATSGFSSDPFGSSFSTPSSTDPFSSDPFGDVFKFSNSTPTTASTVSQSQTQQKKTTTEVNLLDL